MQNGWKHTESVSNKMISQFRSLEELYKDASISLACMLFYISVLFQVFGLCGKIHG